MADVVVRSSQPALAAIKLAWWRERLEELDQGKVPAEPRLRAAASELLPRGIRGAELARLEEGWALLLQPDASFSMVPGAILRGRSLFVLAARLLEVPMSDHLENAANAFASVDLARRRITDLPGQKLHRSRYRIPRSERPLSALGALAYRDMRSGGPPFEPEGTPGRAWTLLKHRITGRLGS